MEKKTLTTNFGAPVAGHMHGFGSHTFKWVNARGETVWVKYH